MNPRYQVFVSSTFRDLKRERQAALDAILELGHFPAGMEVFPAANATPWSLIEAIIAESDYYILIVGGMYGTTDEEGVSYTEREYDLACAQGVPVLAFLHKDPAAIPAGLSEMARESRKRLEAFRKKVEVHHCKYWLTPDELKTQTVVSLTHEMRVNPRLGWIRGDQQDSRETLKKLATLMEENAQLQDRMADLRDALGQRTAPGEGLAAGNDVVSIRFTLKNGVSNSTELSWDSIFLGVAPSLMGECDEASFHHVLNSFLTLYVIERKIVADSDLGKGFAIVHDEDFHKIVYQFIALEFIEPITIVEQTDLFGRSSTRREQGYKLTKLGLRTLASKRAIQKSNPSGA